MDPYLFLTGVFSLGNTVLHVWDFACFQFQFQCCGRGESLRSMHDIDWSDSSSQVFGEQSDW